MNQRRGNDMYKVVNKTFKNWDYIGKGNPLVCLEDQYGGQSVIAVDDHCFVLYNGSDTRDFKPVRHWYEEAVDALKWFLFYNPSFKL